MSVYVFLFMYIDVSLNYKKRTLSMIYLFSESFKILFDTIQLYVFNILWVMTVLCVLHQSCSIVATFVVLSHHSLLFTIFPLISFKGKFILRALNLLMFVCFCFLNGCSFSNWTRRGAVSFSLHALSCLRTHRHIHMLLLLH